MMTKAGKPAAISLRALFRRASRDQKFFGSLMNNPEATLAREGLTVDAASLAKVKQVSKIVREGVTMEVATPYIRRKIKLLKLFKSGEWQIDWMSEWFYRGSGPKGIQVNVKFPRF
jgi:hypothetical protein